MAGIFLLIAGCGYRIQSSAGTLPSGVQSLGIPTFRNFTSQYRIEQMITSAVLREFRLRTRVPVNSSTSDVDAVLSGEIRGLNAVPVTFGTQTVDNQTFGNAFMVTVQVSAKLMRLKDSAVLWHKENFLFRDRYILNANLPNFFSEENPALERLSRDVASSLASSILGGSKP